MNKLEFLKNNSNVVLNEDNSFIYYLSANQHTPNKKDNLKISENKISLTKKTKAVDLEKLDDNYNWVVMLDESVNANGVKIKLDGIDFSRYTLNPIMSDNHNISSSWYGLVSIETLLGKVEKVVRTEINGVDSYLAGFKIAEGTPKGAICKYLWDNGFLNAVSIGVYINNYENDTSWDDDDDSFVLDISELFDTAFVTSPAYKHAVNVKNLEADKESIISETEEIETKTEKIEEKNNKVSDSLQKRIENL